MIGDETFQYEFEQRQAKFIKSIKDLQELIYFADAKTSELGVGAIEEKLSYILFRQVFEDFNSILILSGNSFPRNALKILRSMYEHCVTMKYLQEFPDMVELFVDYYHVTRMKQFRQFAKAYDGELQVEDFKGISDVFQSVKSKFLITDCSTCRTTRMNHQWSKLDIVAMASKVGLDKTLTFFCYTKAISYAHPSADSILNRIEDLEDEKWTYKFESPTDERQTLMFSHMMLLIACESLFNQFVIADEKGLLKNAEMTWTKLWNT